MRLCVSQLKLLVVSCLHNYSWIKAFCIVFWFGHVQHMSEFALTDLDWSQSTAFYSPLYMELWLPSWAGGQQPTSNVCQVSSLQGKCSRLVFHMLTLVHIFHIVLLEICLSCSVHHFRSWETKKLSICSNVMSMDTFHVHNDQAAAHIICLI